LASCHTAIHLSDDISLGVRDMSGQEEAISEVFAPGTCFRHLRADACEKAWPVGRYNVLLAASPYCIFLPLFFSTGSSSLRGGMGVAVDVLQSLDAYVRVQLRGLQACVAKE
jgi:hypothetical protein